MGAWGQPRAGSLAPAGKQGRNGKRFFVFRFLFFVGGSFMVGDIGLTT